MATERLYYDDAFQQEFTAEVLSCEPAGAGKADAAAVGAASAAAEAARWRVKLDRTAFYPTSGGQPHDLGKLGDANVKVIDEEDEVVHVVDRAVPIGKIMGHIDWQRRFDHMQQHSGQHLLSAVFARDYALPTVSFHLGAELCNIDVRGREVTQGMLDGASSAVNEIIYEDRAMNVKYGTAEELAAAGVRKTVERSGVLRAMEIADLELQPCGGTHVRRTGQIGTMLLRGVSKIRQDWRVEFVCGRRAERLAREDFASLRAVAERLNCSMQETVAAAERVVAERDAHFKSARAGIEKLAEVEARALLQGTESRADGLRVVTRVVEGLPLEYAQCFAREIAKAENSVALVARSECGSIFFSQHPTAGKDMNALLGAALKEVGGKGGGSRDAARGRLAETQRIRELLSFAEERIRRAE